MHLRDDELMAGLADQIPAGTLAAATYARVPTAVGFTRMLTPLGNYFIARPAARQAAQTATAETDVPLDAAVVLGLTGDALHVWSADPMLNRVHDYLGHVPLARISAIEVTPGRSWQPMRIDLEEGQSVTLESRGAGHALAAAYREHRDQ